MLDDLELSLMAFPQSWTQATNTLRVNLLVLPVGSPLGPVGSVPVFAATTVKLTAQLIAGPALPSTGTAPAHVEPFVAAPPIGAVALLTSMQARLRAGTTVTTGKVTPADAPTKGVRIMKALPPSYTRAVPFSRPRNRDLFVVGDGYGCAVRAQDPGIDLPKPAPTIAWGQLISYILHQPALAEACGFVYQTSLTIPPALQSDVAWVSFGIDTSDPTNPFAADLGTPDVIRSYAARLPPLAGDRKLFAAALFPVVAAPGATLAEADFEAAVYDDGFAQIIHCHQPPTTDTATGDTAGLPPGAEAGIQLAWDDEQVTIWLDRQVGNLRDRANRTSTNPEAPLGVLGYRVDVRESGAIVWNPLCDVNGVLPFTGAASNGGGTTPSGELFVNPAPIRSRVAAAADDPGWLPLYFAAWRGVSLVSADPVVARLAPPPSPTAPPPPGPSALAGVPVPPPRYGHDYEFRVRLADLTGGGPRVGDRPEHPGLAPIGTCPFRRFIPPKALEIDASPPAPPLPARPEASRTITKLVVRRSHIGYPEAIFAGVPQSTFEGASLDALIAGALASGRAVGVPDPDVDRFRVTVEAAIPDHDTGRAGTLPGDLDGRNWRIVYTVVEHFPAGDDPFVTLALDYQDTPDIAAMTPPADDATSLPIPTARDIRIRLTPLTEEKSNYYGTPLPPDGIVSDYITRREATSEATLFPFDPPHQLRACWLQPGGNLPALLAQALGLTQNGLTLGGAPGQRTVFAVSGALRATLGGDRGTLTLATSHELLEHWIVALTLDIARDWTWEGFAEPALTVSRDGVVIGTLAFSGTVAAAALGDLAHPADRSMTQLVFLDAITPHPASGAFPTVLEPVYAVTARFRQAPAIQQSWTGLRLPITTRPAQTPKIVSTGIAESPYVAAADYSSTGQRDRFLWIEFDAPIADADDTYFGRVLAYGPDPLLAVALSPPQHAPDPEPPPLPIDPEAIRVVFAGEDSDQSGLEAMMPLVEAKPSAQGPDRVHYLLPLPPGIAPDALELFGFWTYEFRVGHRTQWSTAQGRFGRPLQVSGIQHPPPRLACTTWRNTSGITVTAPYATTLLDGQPALDLRHGDPQTALWFMLYAQVVQTDGRAHRNVLVGRQPGTLVPQTVRGKPAVTSHSQNRERAASRISPRPRSATCCTCSAFPPPRRSACSASSCSPAPSAAPTSRYPSSSPPPSKATRSAVSSGNAASCAPHRSPRSRRSADDSGCAGRTAQSRDLVKQISDRRRVNMAGAHQRLRQLVGQQRLDGPFGDAGAPCRRPSGCLGFHAAWAGGR